MPNGMLTAGSNSINATADDEQSDEVEFSAVQKKNPRKKA